jgi:lysophospholipase L1-like esterase
VLVLLLLTALTACGGGRTETAAAPLLEPAAGGTLSFGVVGDSLTAGVGPALAGTSVPGAGSWLPGAVGEPLDFRGGWAVPGARTADMAAGAVAIDADVLVVLAGTNDLASGVPWPQVRDNLLTIVQVAGVDDVVLVDVPPLDLQPAAVGAFNAQLAELADDQGWQLVDPWAHVRAGESWAPGASADGIHPTEAVADVVGTRIRAALLDSARG